MKAHGFPSSEKRNSGSKVSRLPAIMVISAAGLLSEKVGKSEMPLFVTPADPPKYFTDRVLSVDCPLVGLVAITMNVSTRSFNQML